MVHSVSLTPPLKARVLPWDQITDPGLNYCFLFLEFSVIALHFQNVFTVLVERREQVPFSMAMENEELMRESSPEHLRITTAG